MKHIQPIACLLLIILFSACTGNKQNGDAQTNSPAIEGAWQLISGTTVENAKTTHTDYTKGEKMIKIITPAHFAFFRHDLNKGKDSASAIFTAGGGTYTLKGDQYVEALEYCNYREWEGNSFTFTVAVHGDTLIQTGLEKIANLNIERTITERYVRIGK